MALAYRLLTAEQKADIDKGQQKPVHAVPDDATLRAWEAAHYAASLLLAAATTDVDKAAHTATMRRYERAVHAARRGDRVPDEAS